MNRCRYAVNHFFGPKIGYGDIRSNLIHLVCIHIEMSHTQISLWLRIAAHININRTPIELLVYERWRNLFNIIQYLYTYECIVCRVVVYVFCSHSVRLLLCSDWYLLNKFQTINRKVLAKSNPVHLCAPRMQLHVA